MEKLDKGMVSILACPGCKKGLAEEKGSLRCRDCGISYPVRKGIPDFTKEER